MNTSGARRIAGLKRPIIPAILGIILMSMLPGSGVTTESTANRLVHEASPYLQQHAQNPVDWYPWGEEAFAAARAADKPIFLSIGYSTCHWCHVMAHESFEDPTVAALLNEAFICVKVDREERPDIDHIYMAVCQMMTGSGGWPLTIIMTPEREPFFAATYIPKESRFGRTGLMELIPRIKEVWDTDRKRITSSVESVLEALQRGQESAPGREPGAEILERARDDLLRSYDPVHGGFGSKPKFPTPHKLLLLMRNYHRSGDEQVLEMVEKTLTALRQGGIYDQVGFGFHRYSTDAQWLVPHFEKMLYDQALLMMAYTEAWLITGKAEYAATVDEIATYVFRDLTAPEGGFYSAEDADSEGEEGKFYLWTTVEIEAALDPSEAAFVRETFNLAAEGNFADEAGGQVTGRNILHLQSELSAEQVKTWGLVRERLLKEREQRIRPSLDDKVLTDWNGLMISALARAGQALDRPRYVEAAEEATRFIMEQLSTPSGRLLHRYRQGQAGIPGNVDDYAFLIAALLDLYEATFKVSYLERAMALEEILAGQFWDGESGGYYFTAADGEQLILRSKQVYDGAVPSGNSVAALNLLRLGRITGDAGYEETAAALLRAFSRQINLGPTAYSQLLCAVDFAVGPAFEVVIAGEPEAQSTRDMLAALRGSYHPNKVVLLRPAGEAGSQISRLAPFTATQVAIDGLATAYVCRNFSCRAPTTDTAEMLTALGMKN